MYVDINNIGDLHKISKNTPLIVGGGVNLTDLQGILSSVGSTNTDYWYAQILAEHIGKIGSVPLRNVWQNIIFYDFRLQIVNWRQFFSL